MRVLFPGPYRAFAWNRDSAQVLMNGSTMPQRFSSTSVEFVYRILLDSKEQQKLNGLTVLPLAALQRSALTARQGVSAAPLANRVNGS